MSRIKTEAWVRAGYKLFGEEGIEGIKVERLARILQLNKSGFYHYFGSTKIYLKRLLQYHIIMAKSIAQKITSCENIDPDLLHFIIRHKTFFLVESQLLVKCKQAQFGADIDEASRIVNKELLPLWRKTMQLPEDSAVALSYLNIILYFFYAQINQDNMRYEFLHSLTFDIKAVLNKVMNERPVASQNIERPASSE